MAVTDPNDKTTPVEADPDGEAAKSRESTRQAAILLTLLGPETAKKILQDLDDDEVELLLQTAAQIATPSEEEATTVLENFNQLMRGDRLLVPAARAFAKQVGNETIGSQRTNALLGVKLESEADGLSRANGMSAESIAKVLQKEHPQTAALALSSLPTDKAAHVIAQLPEEQRPVIIRRIAELKSIQSDLVLDIGETLQAELRASAGQSKAVDGQDIVVSLLKQLSPEDEEAIFTALSEEDPELSEEIRKKMFVFEDFVTLDGRAIQLMLKEVDSRTLTLALKTSSTPLREHILSCMSSRAATMIIEDLDALGPVAVTQVASAQDEIVQVALRLAAEGKLSLR